MTHPRHEPALPPDPSVDPIDPLPYPEPLTRAPGYGEIARAPLLDRDFPFPPTERPMEIAATLAYLVSRVMRDDDLPRGGRRGRAPR